MYTYDVLYVFYNSTKQNVVQKNNTDNLNNTIIELPSSGVSVRGEGGHRRNLEGLIRAWPLQY